MGLCPVANKKWYWSKWNDVNANIIFHYFIVILQENGPLCVEVINTKELLAKLD